MQIIETTVPSTDGVHQLYVRIFQPEGEIKGLFQVVHGMTEYITRYDRLLETMARRGYVAFGHNHLGHKTTASDDELGFIGHKDGHRYLIDDTAAVGAAIAAGYEKLPHILFGHSMGSFVVRLAALKMPIDKLIVCGTAGPNSASAMGIAACKLIKTMRGERHISNLIEFLAFGSYNKKFAQETPYDWLSVDKENVRVYMQDKYCTFRFTVSAMQDLITLIQRCNGAKWFSQISKTVPVLLIAGEEDPVGDYGNGVKKVYYRLKEQDCQVSLCLYPGARHEILNDFCKDKVIDDIVGFTAG